MLLTFHLRNLHRTCAEDVGAGHQAGAIVKRLQYQRGSTVRVRLFDARVLRGEVRAIIETTSGRKVRILSGACVLTVGAEQVITVIKAVR